MVDEVNSMFTMKQLIEDETLFENYPCAGYATDVVERNRQREQNSLYVASEPV